MTVVLWVGVVLIGGASSVLRSLVADAIASRTPRAFPYGTLVINLSGAGLLAGLAPSHDEALLAGTAAVGSYTTFSTWVFETQRLGEDRKILNLAANLGVSLFAGVAAAALGQLLGNHL
jgi:fluoride exporter